ncbi:hypothetical protein N7467_001719, partial [Penicillium canescens]
MSDLNFEDMMTDVNQGMEYLHNLADINQVVILGHSGGGTMMAAYQNIAEYAIIDESTRSKLNQSLNLLNPANGFGNNTLANYTAEFRRICESYPGEFGNTL